MILVRNDNSQFNSTVKKLSLVLRDSVEAKHEEVRNQQFVKNLTAQSVTKESYQKYLVDLLAIYSALETSLWEMASDPKVGPLVVPELFRKDKIKKDLKGLQTFSFEPTASGKAYVEHIESLKVSAPHRLAAHAYTRYLGDLFGGQTIGEKVGALFGNEVTAFYNFDELIDDQKIRSAQMYVRTFRNILDALPLNPQEQQEVVDEAGLAFDFATACLKELA